MSKASKSVSYKDLTRLLLDHGFRITRFEGSHHLFEHKSGTVILLPANESSKAAMPVQVGAVRRILDQDGHLDVDDFDREFHGADGRAKPRRRARV